METPILVILAVLSAGAAYVWARSARQRLRLLGRLESDLRELDQQDSVAQRAAITLTRGDFRRDTHAALLYALVAFASIVVAITQDVTWVALFGILALPAGLSLLWSRNSVKEARLSAERFELERRAEEALTQENLAPRAWAGRLAPDELPDFSGFDVGRVYQAGSGLMAGDFFDLFRISDTRLAAVVGDVAGHGIESSITAFQAKYLLRVFLESFRDPAQALEELNSQMSGGDRIEEFISLVVVVFDTQAGTLRFASAGHPTAFLWHEREVQPLAATGQIMMLDPNATYISREIPLELGDMVLMYTDGLAEVRNGEDLFGEDRIAQHMSRDPGIAPDVLAKSLLEAARDFSSEAIEDDVAIMAVRRE
ncbi:MAG: PP2C family protein-serine/threonine phosphatase [Acidimicrobiales bacterium]